MSDSVRPHRRQPTRLPHPWDSPGKNTGVGCHFLLQCMKVKVKLLSHVRPLATLWIAAYQDPLSMGFSRQEYWSGLPFPPPGYLPDPGIKSAYPAPPALASKFFTTEPPGRRGPSHPSSQSLVFFLQMKNVRQISRVPY